MSASDHRKAEYVLVVIGCGAAGLSAAISYSGAARAQGRSARIAVLERASREERGGATRWTSSWFRITADRRLDPAFIGLMEKVSNGLADLDYCRRLESEISATLSFLENNGVELIYFQQPFPNRNSGGGLGMPARGGVGIVDGLAAVIDRTPDAEILYATEATRLSTSKDGRVDGVIVRGRDGRAARGIDPPKSNWAFPLAPPPFIAYPLTCAITFTFGGVRTDSLARVVTPAGVPIPGLYAAGEVTGLYYHHYPAGTSVLRSATFGRIAGAHAASLIAAAAVSG